MSRQPLLIALLLFATGILVVEYTTVQLWLVITPLVISILLLFFILLLNVKQPKVKLISISLFMFSLGMFFHYFNNQHPNNPYQLPQRNYVFQLEKKLNSNSKYKRYEVSILTTTRSGQEEIVKSVVSLPKETRDLDYKHYYSALIYLKKVELPKHDFQFNYAKYLYRQKIEYQGWINGEIQSAPKKMTFSDQIKQWRLETLWKISESNLLPTSKEFAKGIILADRTEMGQEMTEDFSKTGLVHFLAISGTHMIVIFWLISFVLMKLFPKNLKKLAIVLSLIFIWIFTVFIDYGSSVVRSALMLTVYYSFVMFNRKPDVLHSLSLAGFILLIANTQSLFDVGFQLSFLAVLGIYWLNPSFEKLFPKPRNNFQKFFISITSVSISAQLATLPLVIYYFHQYSVLSIFVNILIVPFSEIIIIFSLLMTLLLGIGLEINWIDWLFDRVVTILMEVIHFFSKIDWAYFENIPLSLVEVVLLFVLIYHIPNIVLKKNNKQIVIFSFFLMMTFAVRLFLNFYYNNKNEVLTMKNGKKEMLILKKKNKVFFYIPDGSDTISIKKYTVNPYLSSRRTNNYRLRFIPNNSGKVLIDGKLYNLK